MNTSQMMFFTLDEQAQIPAEPEVFETVTYHGSQERLRAELSAPLTGAPGQVTERNLRSIYTTCYRGPARVGGARVDFVHTLETLLPHADGPVTLHSRPVREVTLRRTPSGLVLTRTSTDGRRGTWRMLWSQSLGADSSGHITDELMSRAAAPLDDAGVHDHLGPLPCVSSHAPLLDHRHRDAVPVASQLSHTTSTQVASMPPAVIWPWLGAANAAQVARTAFGPTNYRKPLARLVGELHPARTAFYAHFAHLVPVEHIITAMDTAPRPGGNRDLAFRRLSQADHVRIRALLRLLPQALCSRLLASTDTAELVMALRDGAQALYAEPASVEDHPHLWRATDPVAEWGAVDHSGRRPTDLRMLIDQMGHKRIRSATDLEHLIGQIPSGVKFTYHDAVFRDRQLRELDRLAEITATRQMHQVNQARAELEPPLEALSWVQWSDPQVRHTEQQRFQDRIAEQMAERQRQAAAAEQEAIAARQQVNAKRAAAFVHNAHLLKQAGHICDGRYRIVVADNAATLKRWGAVMGNCIGGYTHQLGLTVLAGLVRADDVAAAAAGGVSGSDASSDAEGQDQSVPVVNFQIEGGRITQILCRRNRTLSGGLGKAAGQQVLDELRAIGNWQASGAWGVAGLDTSTGASPA